MEENIYREEYIREQARIEARRNAETKPKSKSQLLRYAAPAMFIGLLGYAVFNVGVAVGFNPRVFLEMDFIVAAVVLTGLFIWARNS